MNNCRAVRLFTETHPTVVKGTWTHLEYRKPSEVLEDLNKLEMHSAVRDLQTILDTSLEAHFWGSVQLIGITAERKDPAFSVYNVIERTGFVGCTALHGPGWKVAGNHRIELATDTTEAGYPVILEVVNGMVMRLSNFDDGVLVKELLIQAKHDFLPHLHLIEP